MTLVARHAARSDIGLHRKSNEDAYVTAPPLFAVCDGMGGALGGEVASRVAADTLVAAVAAGEPLLAAAEAANTAVYERATGDASLAGMGTTLTALLVDGDTGRFAHIGDSRAYLLRDDALAQLSDDHSLVGEMMRDGRLTAAEAAAHPHRSILSRALGTEPQARIDEFQAELRAGDVVLLCSDGLSGPAPESVIREALGLDDPEAAAGALVAAAREGGGPDNITVVVVRFEAADDDAADEGGLDATLALSLAEAPDDSGQTTLVLTAAAVGPAQDEAADGDAHDEAIADGGARDGSAADDASDGSAADDAPPDATPGTAAQGGHDTPRGSRRRLGCLLVVLLVLVALGAGAALVLTTVYYVGVDDGALTVYSGLPLSLGPLDLHAVYRRSTKPYGALDAAGRRLVDAHTLRSREGALALAQDLGMWP